MIINGKEIEFKLSIKSHAASFENALIKIQEKEQDLVNIEGKSLEWVIDNVVNMFRTFFIDATGVDVLESCEDAEEAQQAYLDFLAEIQKQKNKIISAYSPKRIK